MVRKSNLKKLIFFLFSTSFLLLIHPVHAQDSYFSSEDCSNSANYTSNSRFQNNLNLLLSSLLSNDTVDGYFENTVGSSPDTVHGLVQCRDDISTQDCKTCLNKSTVDIIQRCPNRKSASLRFEYCILRYSNTPFSGEADTAFQSLSNPQRVSDADVDHFDQQLGSLLNNLSTIAASRQSRYDSGLIDYKPFNNIYGLAQCTRDLSPTNCLSCLQNAISFFSSCCNRSVGARAYSATCYVRYDFFQFVQIQPQSPPPLQQVDALTKHDGKSTHVLAIVAPVFGGSALLLAICVFIIIMRTKKNWSKRKSQLSYDKDDMRSEESLHFHLNTIRTATNDFSDANKLGEGGFGAVYKGELVDGQEVAVKRLSVKSRQGLQEFKNEVTLLHKLHHRNLVRLFGFCLSGEEKLLIYEYIPNTSLDKYLFDPTRKASLNWERRYKIIGGIARGLLYLDEDSRLRIIHRDLKAGNILLDKKMNAKIADFGTAKLFGVDQTHGNTNRIAGTFGYMAPEYALNGSFSVKSDVYSFGVLVLEIITGQATNKFHLSGLSGYLTSCVWKQWRDGNALEMMDPTLLDNFSANEVLRCIHIGLLCVQNNLKDRPTMSSVLLMLNNHFRRLDIPASPAFMPQTMTAAIDPEKSTEFKDSSQVYSDYEISYDFPR